MEKKLLSVEEASKVLGMVVAKVYNLARTSGFPAIRVGRRIYVSADGLNKWIEENEGKQILLSGE